MEHLKVVGILGVVRAVLGLCLGAFLLWKSGRIAREDYLQNHFELAPPVFNEEDETTLRFDRWAFQVGGVAFLALAGTRLVQGAALLTSRVWALPLGLGLAGVDLVNLAFFPLSTALGLYALQTQKKALRERVPGSPGSPRRTGG